jgi:hypothetical protein
MPGWRDQPNFMAKLAELAGPVMCSITCLQRYGATRLGCEEIQQLSSAEPNQQGYPSCLNNVPEAVAFYNPLSRASATIRTKPGSYVKPFAKRQKNDAIDAEAICEAASATKPKCYLYAA